MAESTLGPLSVERPLARLAALGLAVAGALYYNLLPLSLGLLQEEEGFSNGQLGLLSAAFFLGFNLLSGTSFFWVQRFSWRNIALLATSVSLLAMGAMAFANTFIGLAATSVLAGGAFSALYALAAAIIGEQTNQTRWFGLKISVEGLSGAVLFVVLPGTLIASMGFDGILLGMAIAVLLLCPLWLWLPDRTPIGVTASSAKAEALNSNVFPVWLALIGTLVFFAGQTTIWAFIERLGSTAGYDSEAVTTLLSVTLLCAVAGSMTAATLGNRLGNRTPFILSCLIFFAAVFCLNYPQSFPAYAFGACAAMFSVAAGLAFGIAEIAVQDPNGRFIVLSVPAVGAGAMFGPGLAGFLADAHGYGAVLGFGVAAVALGALLFLVIGITERVRSDHSKGVASEQ
ncbi:MAG: MFS transporter [Pseudomonadales bacterium]